MSAERWVPVFGWEDLYEVSDQGRVRSLVRNTLTGIRGGALLHLSLTAKGYQRVRLSRDSSVDGRFVHVLVLEAFVGPRPAKMQCRHLDGDPTNNTLGNLAWGTPGENLEDKVRHGRIPRGEASSNSKLSDAEVLSICEQRRNGATIPALAEQFGVNPATIRRIIGGKGWTHIVDRTALPAMTAWASRWARRGDRP